MTVNIAEDIYPITELKRDTSAMVKKVNETGRPLVLTVNGKAQAVLMGAGEFDRLSQAMIMLRSLVPAEEDVRQGRVMDARTFFRKFRRDKKIPG